MKRGLLTGSLLIGLVCILILSTGFVSAVWYNPVSWFNNDNSITGNVVSPTCIETDDGIDWGGFGNTTIVATRETKSDCCNLVGSNTCVARGPTLSEKYCNTSSATRISTREHLCDNGCVNGACLRNCQTFNYSSWGECRGGVQTRTVLAKSPSGCVNGTPIVRRECILTNSTISPVINRTNMTTPVSNRNITNITLLTNATSSFNYSFYNSTVCGNESYNNNFETCCIIAGKANLIWGKNEKCSEYKLCNGEVYQTSEGTCCRISGKERLVDEIDYVFNAKTEKKEPQCSERAVCGEETYLKSEETCCGDKQVISGNNVKCSKCGNRYYDSADSTCCKVGKQQGVIYGKNAKCSSCDGVIFDKNSFTCCKTGGEYDLVFGKNAKCSERGYCGDEFYNKSSQSCCKIEGKQKIVNGKDATCAKCGDKVYNKNKATCCTVKDTKKVVSGKDAKCSDFSYCNGTFYDSRKDTCCNIQGSTILLRSVEFGYDIYTDTYNKPRCSDFNLCKNRIIMSDISYSPTTEFDHNDNPDIYEISRATCCKVDGKRFLKFKGTEPSKCSEWKWCGDNIYKDTNDGFEHKCCKIDGKLTLKPYTYKGKC
jgi:hypothetical protein